MQKHTSLSFYFKKAVLLAIHCFFIAVALTCIGFLYHNEHYGRGIGWLRTETYEDTAFFSDQVKEDAWKIFQYVQCRDAFETNGKVDYSKVIIDAYYGPGDMRSYSINEFILYAKSHGYYLDPNWNVAFEPTALSGTDTETFLVDWKAYNPKYNTDDLNAEQTLAAETTMEELSKEVLTYLGSYYYINEYFLTNQTNFYFQVTYKDQESDQPILFSNAPKISMEEWKKIGKYIYISSELPNDFTNFSQPIHSLNVTAEQAAPYEHGTYDIWLLIDTSYPYEDMYYDASISYQETRTTYIRSLWLTICSLLICLVTFLALIVYSGHQDHSKEIHLHKFDQIKTEFFLFFCLIGTLIGLFLYQRIGCKLIHILVPMEHWFYWEKILRILVFYLAAFFTSFGMLRRYKAKTLWENSITNRCIHAMRLSISHQRFSVTLLIISISYLIASILLIGAGSYLLFMYSGKIWSLFSIPLLLIWIGLSLFLLYHLLLSAVQQDKLNSALQHLASGETNYQVPLDDFSGKEKEMAENINNISSGLDTALQEKVRSERLKADLITNVSHDIKTPLTSIINYVDLIKREQITDPKILRYLEILDQKSQRLKTLTEDLVEASKASSGNMKLEIMNIDLVELVQQTAGEFEEKFASRHLTMIMNLPKESVIIAADGRRMWRILENLYNNACKYAMEQSRVYIDVFVKESNVYFTIKNISANPLNIRPEELTERFVRGDVSRTTEGSGLGLSIAKNLTELQKGTFTIYIDGDFFKAELCFPIQSSPSYSPINQID